MFRSHFTKNGTFNSHFLNQKLWLEMSDIKELYCNTVNSPKISIGLSRVKKIFFQNFFCISIILLIHIMGICCGPFKFFCLGGQYYGSGHPRAHFGQYFALYNQPSHQKKGKYIRRTLYSRVSQIIVLSSQTKKVKWATTYSHYMDQKY